MKITLLLAGAALAASAGAVGAQPVVALPTKPIIITASRVAQTADEVLAPVTVITREDIRRRQVHSVQEALRSVPGLSIANSGGAGKLTSVFLRGTEADHVLVLVDGIKIGSATAGTAAFQDIPIDQIERIEIVRGPRSSLYGSEAIGGVIQIFTRRGEGPPTGFVSTTAGSHSSFGTTAGVSAGTDRASLFASVGTFDTEGINACRGSQTAGCFVAAPDPDKDGYRNVSGSMNFGYRFDAGTEIDIHWLRAEGENEFDGFSSDASDTLQETYGAQVRFAPSDSWDVGIRAGRSRDESDGFLGTAFVDRFATRRETVSLQNDFAIATDQVLTLGADYYNDSVDSTTAFAVTERDNSAVFAQYQAIAGRHHAELSLRRDDNEQFGDHATGGAAWAYDVSQRLRLRFSYGTAFRAPTFNELYFPNFSNPNLRPEEAENAEAGFTLRRHGVDWSLSLFQTDVDNLIGLDQTFTPINIDSARIRGVETTASAHWHAWTATASLTLLDPENQSQDPDESGNDLPRRARRILDVDLARAFGRYRLGLALHAEGRRFDDLANRRRLGGYALVGVRGAYALSKRWLLQARVSNLLDKNYETVMFFNQPGRELFVTLRYDPRASLL